MSVKPWWWIQEGILCVCAVRAMYAYIYIYVFLFSVLMCMHV